MNPSRIFIERPVATTLLTVAIAHVDFPTIVSASLPDGSPDIMSGEQSPEAA